MRDADLGRDTAAATLEALRALVTAARLFDEETTWGVAARLDDLIAPLFHTPLDDQTPGGAVLVGPEVAGHVVGYLADALTRALGAVQTHLEAMVALGDRLDSARCHLEAARVRLPRIEIVVRGPESPGASRSDTD